MQDLTVHTQAYTPSRFLYPFVNYFVNAGPDGAHTRGALQARGNHAGSAAACSTSASCRVPWVGSQTAVTAAAGVHVYVCVCMCVRVCVCV